MSEGWSMSRRDFSDCKSLAEVETKIMRRIDRELDEQHASEIAMLEDNGATAAELSDFSTWRKETYRRWRETTARELYLFLRHDDFVSLQ